MSRSSSYEWSREGYGDGGSVVILAHRFWKTVSNPYILGFYIC